MPLENITDVSQPNPGRIYDYILGGNHNFEVDRQAAEQLIKLLPFIPKYARLQRWTLQDIAVELSQRRRYDVIIDLASGLPTSEHIHHNVLEGTTVIYSDNDPVTVEYAHHILDDTPNVYYFETDATHPETLLNDPQVQHILAGRRNVAFVFWGVTAFVSDEAIAHLARYLYEWSGPESCLVFNAQTANPNHPAAKQVNELYKKMGIKTYGRGIEAFESLIKPWQLESSRWLPLLKWHGLDESVLDQEDVEAFGPMGGGYGAYLIK